MRKIFVCLLTLVSPAFARPTNFFHHYTYPRVALQEVAIKRPKWDTPIIGCMGSAKEGESKKTLERSRRIGKRLGELGVIALSGAPPGRIHQLMLEVQKWGGWTIGISPWATKVQHIKHGNPVEGYDVMILTDLTPAQKLNMMWPVKNGEKYTGEILPIENGKRRPNIMGRAIDNIEWSDALLYDGGRSGTLAEFAIGYEEGKPLGVLLGSGRTANKLPGHVKDWLKDGKARNEIVVESNPEILVDKVVEMAKLPPMVIRSWDK